MIKNCKLYASENLLISFFFTNSREYFKPKIVSTGNNFSNRVNRSATNSK